MTRRGWTCWWWPIHFDVQHEVPVPQARTFYGWRAKQKAIRWGKLLVEAGSSWAKVFREGDEAHEVWRSKSTKEA